MEGGSWLFPDAFDLSYRIGGEEFLVVLPGATRAQALDVAEELRTGIAAGPWAGHSVTMSFGVSASDPGDAFDYEAAFEEADVALYEAKRSGRNRVCAGDHAAELAAAV